MQLNRIFAVAVVVASAMPSVTLAQAGGAGARRCPAGETGCTIDNAHSQIRERVNDGARRILRDENPYGRVNEARKTLEYCVKCGTEAIKEGMDRVGGDRGRGGVR